MTKANILVSITGNTPQHWQSKLQEIEDLKMQEVALFLEIYDKAERENIYRALKSSCIKSIPLVHIRHDMEKDELEFLQKNFKTKYFTCHEENFVHGDLAHWKGFYQDIFLEMNFDNFVSKKVTVETVGGFCIDLAHFKCAMERLSKDFDYVYERKDMHKYFACNHIGGYNPQKNIDMHTIYSLNDFDYLKLLPRFVFSNTMAIEVFNPIKEQLEFKKYLETIL